MKLIMSVSNFLDTETVFHRSQKLLTNLGVNMEVDKEHIVQIDIYIPTLQYRYA